MLTFPHPYSYFSPPLLCSYSYLSHSLTLASSTLTITSPCRTTFFLFLFPLHCYCTSVLLLSPFCISLILPNLFLPLLDLSFSYSKLFQFLSNSYYFCLTSYSSSFSSHANLLPSFFYCSLSLITSLSFYTYTLLFYSYHLFLFIFSLFLHLYLFFLFSSSSSSLLYCFCSFLILLSAFVFYSFLFPPLFYCVYATSSCLSSCSLPHL